MVLSVVSKRDPVSVVTTSWKASKSMYVETARELNSGEMMEKVDTGIKTENIQVQNMHCILDQLTEEELEGAARMSYEYQTKENPTDDLRRSYATDALERYISAKTNQDVALQQFKETLKFRKEYNLDNLQQLTIDRNDEISKFMEDRKAYVQGYDTCGRSTLLFIPRNTSDFNKPEQNLLGHIWTMEKAIACTKSKDRTINVVADFNDFSLYYHSPPLSLGKTVMTTLRKHYVGQIHRIFLVNVPTTFSILWTISKPFAGTKTRRKIVLIGGNQKLVNFDELSINASQTKISLCQYYTAKQSTPWMVKDGQKRKKLNVDNYINQIPFDHAFDDEE
jgi:CRAL/TRIO domain